MNIRELLKIGKKNKKENEKVANRKLEKVGNLGKVIPSFLISEFSILPYSQNWKLRFKNLRKKYLRFPRFPKFPRLPSFRPGPGEQSQTCEGPILENELLKALKNVSNNKSPGNDGLTKEFYEMFGGDLKKSLCQYYKSFS